MTTGLLSSCIITDDYLDDSIRQKFESGRNQEELNKFGAYDPDLEVNVVRAIQMNDATAFWLNVSDDVAYVKYLASDIYYNPNDWTSDIYHDSKYIKLLEEIYHQDKHEMNGWPTIELNSSATYMYIVGYSADGRRRSEMTIHFWPSEGAYQNDPRFYVGIKNFAPIDHGFSWTIDPYVSEFKIKSYVDSHYEEAIKHNQAAVIIDAELNGKTYRRSMNPIDFEVQSENNRIIIATSTQALYYFYFTYPE